MDEMNRKPQALQQALVNRMGPSLHDNTRPHVAQPMLPKMNELCHRVLPHLPCSPDPLLTDYYFFKCLRNFLQGKHFYNQQEACFPRVCQILKHGFLFHRNKQTYFSLAKNVLSVIVPILINKDVFEHSYYDLKFTVQNHNHSSTNLLQIF